MIKDSKQKGFIGTLIIIIIALIFVKYYFHVDPITFFNSSQFQDVVSTFKSFFVSVYNWISGIVNFIINNKK